MKLFDVYSIFDLEIVKALGSTLWDSKGQAYLDLYGGHAVISIGHSHPKYVKAIAEQLEKIAFYSNSVKIDLQNKLADKLGRLSGYDNYKLFLCNSGAEANENAFKLASFQNGRKKIIAFKSSFHGRTSLAVAATDNPNISATINQNEHIQFLPFNDISALEKAIDETICAVIIEGIQGVAGIYIPTRAFMQRLKFLCQKYSVILILDEVQSGYGRTGKFFAHQDQQIRPDLITIAKGMGNGFPVAGVLINPMFKAKKESLGTTFGGSYLACAAALAVLTIIEEESLIQNAVKMGNYFYNELKSISQLKEIRAKGLMIGLEFEKPSIEIRKELLFKHNIFTGSAANKNTLRLLPSLAISENEINSFVKALKLTLN